MAGYTKGFLYRARFTQTELESMLSEAKAQLIESGPESIMSWNDNGTNITNRRDLTTGQWVDEIIFSLAMIDPTYADRELPNSSTAVIHRRYA